MIDFDSQGNATQGLNASQNNSQATIHSVLMEGVPIQQAIVPKMNPRIDIVPANINLAGADLDMDKMEAGKEELLKKAIAPIRDQYDYIIIDCPPSLGLLNTNALTAADSILIPVQCEYYALEGVTQLLITIRLVQRTSNRNLKIEGILLTMFDIRTRLSVEVSQDVRQTFGKLVYQNSIPRNVKLSEAPSRGMSIFEYDPKSTGAKAYAGLTEEVLNEFKGGIAMDNKNNARLGKGLSSNFGQDVSKVLDDIQNGDMEVEDRNSQKFLWMRFVQIHISLVKYLMMKL